MSNQLFEPVKVNGTTIHWGCISGRAVGVQKYTKTHVSGGGHGQSSVTSWIETIIELSIEQSNGQETPITLYEENIRVREGQRVSGIWGYTERTNSCWLIFVNHDYQKWYWLCTSTRFFQSLSMFPFLIEMFPFLNWLILLLIVSVLIVSVGTLVFAMFSSYILQSFLLMIALLIALLIVIAIVVYVFQKIRIHLAWRAIRPQILDMARQLRY